MSDACHSPPAARHASHARRAHNEPRIGPGHLWTQVEYAAEEGARHEPSIRHLVTESEDFKPNRSQGLKPETQIFPRSRSLKFGLCCRVAPFLLTNARPNQLVPKIELLGLLQNYRQLKSSSRLNLSGFYDRFITYHRAACGTA